MNPLALLGPLADLGPLPGPVWGVDCSTKRTALGIVTRDLGVRYATKTLRQGTGGADRMSWAVDDLTDWFTAAVGRYGIPALVLIEQPFVGGGAKSKVRVHPQSYYLVASTEIAAYRATRQRSAIEHTNPTLWKKEGMGPGNGALGKPGILAWVREELGYDGMCESCGARGAKCVKQGVAHDEADAQVMAVVAARKVWARVSTAAE